MSFCRSRARLGRRSLKKRRDENLIRTLTYNSGSDGEGSGHDGHSSPPSSSPLWSPHDDIDDHSSEFLEIDLPTSSPRSSPCSSPKLVRRFTRSRRRRSPPPFCLEEIDEDDHDSPAEVRFPAMVSPCSDGLSPPHRKLRALRLFDTPHTPKSLLNKARRRRPTSEKREKSEDCVQANVNPFTTPAGIDHNDSGFCSGKRNRADFERSILDDSTEDEIDIDMPVPKKLALHEINTSRYNEEFHEVCKLGDGEFGSVYKCVHRLDGCTYAIKKSKTPVAGSVYERNALNEVYAHAVLGKHPHVVRYYSAWAEDDHMYIQNEYCNGGSLADYVEETRRTGKVFPESDITNILLHAAQGLRYIHSQNLVHLDIKPGNVFIHRNPRLLQSPESGLESCEEDEEFEEAVIYKIGDLGHVTSVTNPSVEEGDCRYLPSEILAENFDHLPKCDIFSLGLSIFEVCGGGTLPKNGDRWHAIRRGELPYLTNYSPELNALLKSMVHPDPRQRPSAVALTQHSVLCPQGKKSRAQLRKELNEERFKNQMLSRKLIEATQCMINNSPVVPQSFAFGKNTRLVGSKMKRSMSLSAF